jgi:hypothetical protein
MYIKTRINVECEFGRFWGDCRRVLNDVLMEELTVLTGQRLIELVNYLLKFEIGLVEVIA